MCSKEQSVLKAHGAQTDRDIIYWFPQGKNLAFAWVLGVFFGWLVLGGGGCWFFFFL